MDRVGLCGSSDDRPIRSGSTDSHSESCRTGLYECVKMFSWKSLLRSREANKYFKNVVETLNISRMHLAELLSDIRTLNDWKNGKYGIPVETTNWINGESGVKLPVTAKIIDSRLIKSVSGRKGAVVRNKLYGSPGTFEGRRKGGFNSLQTHRKLNTGFKLRKIFIKPAQSVKLAEMFGILIGDGGLSRDQVKITLSSRESAYTQYAIRLAQVIFGYSVSVSHFHTSTNDVYVSSRSAVEFLNDVGLPVGNKVKQNHRIPDWIKRNPDFLRSCLKGYLILMGQSFR